MPRQLPWKVGGAATKQPPSRPKVSASPARSGTRSPAASHRTTPTPKPESTPNPSRKPRRSLGLSSVRSPSTSPPPEPLKEEFMIEGIDHDDRYRMVEDEFLAVAGEFTRHLHAAEYQRLKGLAKSENAEAIQNISRPVTGEMTDLVKRRHAALDTASKQRKGIAKMLAGRQARGNESRNDDDEDDNEKPARRPATSLQGLMESPRKQSVLLTSVTSARPGSSHRTAMDASPSRRRLSAAVARKNSLDISDRNHRVPSVRSKPESTLDSDDDDDLDAQPPCPRKSELRRPEPAAMPPARQSSAQVPPARTRPDPSDVGNPFLRAGTTRLQSLAQGYSASKSMELDRSDGKDEEEDDLFARLRARRAEQRRRRETKAQDSNIKTSESQAAALNSIPFL